MKQQFTGGKAGTIRLSVFDTNVRVVPDTAVVTLFDPSGTEIQAQTSATIDATTGEMTYVVSALLNTTRDLNYIADWEYTYNSTTYYEKQLYDVVRSILSISITDDDLYNELNSLRVTQVQEQGTATSASSTTLVDTVERKESNDYWSGGTVEILSGTGIGQTREITDFVQSTATVTVNPDWATTPDTTSVYMLVRSFTSQIRQSFEKIEQMLINRGKRHSLILESSEVRIPLIYLTVHHICLDLMAEEGDKWDRLSERYEAKYNQAFSEMSFQYDADDSGTITGEEENHDATSMTIGRA